MRRRTVLVVAIGLTAAACAGSDEGESAATSPTSESTATSTPGTPATDPPVTTESSSTTVEATPTTAVATSQPADRPTYEELEALADEGELDPLTLALTGLSAVTGAEIDGAVPIAADESLPDELTPLIDELRALDAELSDAQRARIDELVDQIEAASTVVWTSEDEGPAGADVQGFGGTRNRPGLITAEQASEMFVTARDAVMARLGGTRPTMVASLVDPASLTGPELGWNGWASTDEDESGRWCDVYVVNDDTRTVRGIYETVIHEVFHCWHGQNFDGPVAAYWRVPDWISEGLATWVAAEVIGGSSTAQTRGHRFLLRERSRLFGTSYPAVAFYWQLAALGGDVDHVWNLIPDLADQATSFDGFTSATAGLDGSALSRLASMTLRFDLWGDDAWNFDSRDLGDIGRPPTERTLAGPLFELAQPGEQTIIRIDVELDASRSWVLELARDGHTATRWIAATESELLSGASMTRWCISGECRCPDGREPFPGFEPVPGDDPRFIIGLSGTTEVASVKATPLDVDEACEEEPDVGPELVGVWLADPESTAEAFGEVYDDLGIGVVGASGDLSMTLYSSGRVVLAYEEVRLALDDPTVDTVILNGKGDLTWAIEDGRLVMRGPSDFAISLTTPAFGPDALTVTDEDIELEVDLANARSVFDFERSGSSLTIASAAGFTSDRPDVGVPIVFPRSWVRIGDTP